MPEICIFCQKEIAEGEGYPVMPGKVPGAVKGRDDKGNIIWKATGKYPIPYAHKNCNKQS
jgi:hypothetical protein